MPRDLPVYVFIGIRKSVIALDDRAGAEVWRAELKSQDFVSVHWDGEALFATNAGEVWRLDPQTGAVMWHNELKGLGRGLVTLASTRAPAMNNTFELSAEERRRQAQRHAAAAAG